MGLRGDSMVESSLSTLENLVPNTARRKAKLKRKAFGWPFSCRRGSVTGIRCEGQCNGSASWGWSDGTVPWGRRVMGCPVRA